MDKKKYLDLFEQYINDKATVGEIEELCQFIKDNPQLNKWMEDQIINSSSVIDPVVQFKMLDNIRSNTKYSIAKPKSKETPISNKNFIRWLVNIAAILLPIMLTISLYLMTKSDPINYLTISADLGEKASINLPDGSKVSINSGSDVIYSSVYNKGDRTLKLVGEGYFEVEPNPQKPFIVDCGAIQVKVLGTSFGIKAYHDDDQIAVVLNTGKLELLTPKDTLIMLPNQRVVYNKKGQSVEKYDVDAEDYISWRTNRLRFENETLEQIMKTIGRMHNVEIFFNDDELATLKFTGTINNVSLQSALETFVLTSPLQYRVQDGVVYLNRDPKKKDQFN